MMVVVVVEVVCRNVDRQEGQSKGGRHRILKLEAVCLAGEGETPQGSEHVLPSIVERQSVATVELEES